jgi:dihydropyrimidine dehydrogenase (NAD+) subunit PreT
MTRKATGDIAAGRLPPPQLAENFADKHPRLERQAALVAAARCLYCYDAPCIAACPTGIDIPSFIKRISTDNLRGAATDILGANVFGGTCARVCPTEILCEGSCVRNKDDGKPVEIGALQRYATDWVFEQDAKLFERGPESGRSVAVVGAGPAGLACAHALARAGHRVVVFDAKPKAGGLNEYGIAEYKMLEFAQREIEWLLSIGGIEVVPGRVLGRDFGLAQLREDFDAVFLGMGLAGVNALGIEGEGMPGVYDAVEFIAALRQSENLAALPVGRRVVVIGGGNTAVDAAVQSKKLGAEFVSMVYRRGPDSMSATYVEQDYAKSQGVHVIHWAAPRRLIAANGAVAAIEFEHTRLGADRRLEGSGEFFTLEADTVLKAIGQLFVPSSLDGGAQAIALKGGRIAVDADFATSLPGVYAGGDCVAEGIDLTVQAVEHGKRAARAIDRMLMTAPAKHRAGVPA